MEIALLINERTVRTKLLAGIGCNEAIIREYSTATDALREFSSRQFDLIVMDWKIYPGYGCSDAEIRELASLIPNSPHNENLLYWQVALKVITHIRDEGSINLNTPVLFRFPEIPESYAFGMGDELTREIIRMDLKEKGTIETIYGVKVDDFIKVIRKMVGTNVCDGHR
ncbi:MAG: hypothetical protein PHR77_04270 [Kiritimatiellae bacterium]|nr:hypothetical protein [Kiritimatiellia bacterium]MDD5521409.1 hypothetical protein [Kiritimatiellia bacterium]